MTVAELMDPGRRFDCALRAAEGWRADASHYRGERRASRLRHADRLQAVAEELVKDA